MTIPCTPLTFLAVGLPQQWPRSASASYSPSQARLCPRISTLRPCQIRYFAFHSFVCTCELQSTPARHVAPASMHLQSSRATCPVGPPRADCVS
ncbi:hypothetical protein TIFTF001_031857 [Ficus carica]|uniref:Uncharacterized protein n=1 Tax=Ficus carica TaxID=3494 RepID=A0AA88DVP1_FICCA|nr:hypothetical protein TIFTF001_031857 [Ficus carica]